MTAKLPIVWTKADIEGTLRAADVWWRELVGGHGHLVGDDAARCRAALQRLADGELDQAAAVDEITQAFFHAGRVLHDHAVPPTTGNGRVAQLNASTGGVPKLPVDAADIGLRGLEGDRQAARQHHGRPWQALCLWSAEVIDRLRAEGHPLRPGNAGENVTISGIDWTALRPGVRMAIGEALVETSLWATPCSKNAQWFAGRDFDRMHHERERGVSRIYAWVLEPGAVRTGDAVVVEPD
jgi:MOSC domain-containing protein YiiM